MGYSSKLRESFMNFIVDNNILRGFFFVYRFIVIKKQIYYVVITNFTKGN